jgi:serine/threonine-protein kinase
MSNLIGKTLGRYHILEQIGEGGMATVYKAHDTRLEADVAVKVIRTENLAPNVLERALKRFEREAKTLARLTHPNIVKVMDFGEYEGKPYLVLEYLPGGTLKQRLGNPIPWQEAFHLILPIARALDYAHRQNMIHRDVKPSNILITADGEPMLTDFGIAKVLDLDETADLTDTGMGIGTPEYMAPEQWQGNTSTQSDLYSLGVVLYEMVTGRKPYTANTPAALLLKQANDPLPRPSEFVRDLPDKVEKILLRTLAKEPKERFKDMGELIKAVDDGLKIDKAPFERPVQRPVQTPVRTATANLAGGNRVAEGTRPTQTAVPEKSHGRANAGQSLGRRNRNTLLPVSIILGLGTFLTGVYLFNDYKTSASSSNPQLLTITSEETPITETLVATSVTFTETSLPPTPIPGIGSTMISEKDGMTLLYVPAGEFTMGSTEGNSTEQPVHIVYLDPYWIDQTEVTNGMYALCVKDGQCSSPSKNSSSTQDSYYGNPEFDDFPVIYVTWEHAVDYCSWANRRLPTEAEWEKANRGTDARNYPWGNNEPDETLLNFSGKIGDTSKVGNYQYGASFYGALDMAGNVAEWVADVYRDFYYSSSPISNPPGPETGSAHSIRGGGWKDTEDISCGWEVSQPRPGFTFTNWECKGISDNRNYSSWNRSFNIPETTSEYIGFRCVFSVP